MKKIEGLTINGIKGVRVTATEFVKVDHRDVANAIHSLKQRGIPLGDGIEPDKNGWRDAEAVEAVVQEHALFALACVEAAYNGDHNFFNSLYLIFDPTRRNKRASKKPKIVPDSLFPVIDTAREKGQTPTAQEVADHMKALGKSGAGFTDKRQIEKNVAKAGFEALPRSKRKTRDKRDITSPEVLSAHEAGKTKRKTAPKIFRKKQSLDQRENQE